MSSPQVSDVRLIRAGEKSRATGLLGFISFLLNDWIRIDGVTLRRSQVGRTYLSFPARVDGKGTRHPYLSPVDGEMREALENSVMTALAEGEWQ